MRQAIRAYLNKHTNPPVFIISGLVMVALVALAVVFPSGFGRVADAVESFITHYFGWLYILSATFSWCSWRCSPSAAGAT